MRKLVLIVGVIVTALVFTSCQQGSLQSLQEDQGLKKGGDTEQLNAEILEMEAAAKQLDAQLKAVAPGIWVDLRPDGVRIHMDPPFFTNETIPKFKEYIEKANFDIASDAGVAEELVAALNGALDSAQAEWATLQALSPEQREQLFNQFVKPNAARLDSGSQGAIQPALLGCARASAMKTTAAPGAKAYAKGSCVNAQNSAYARASAGGSTVQRRDSGYNGAYASAVKYGNWSCSSYGAASARVNISGFPITIASDSAHHSGCR